MSQYICSIRLLATFTLLAAVIVWVPEAAARTADPNQPQRWLVVASPNGTWATLYTSGRNEIVATWTDGTVMGLLGELVVDQGTTWVTAQDPMMNEGWMALDRLTDLSTPIVSTPRHVGVGEVGGVQPMEVGGRGLSCPEDFPVKGAIEGRGGYIRLAYPPEHRSYGVVSTRTCFRTLVEAQVWRYVHRSLVQQAPPPEEDEAADLGLDALLP